MSVYFITCRAQGICKIGYAQNPKARRSSLQTAFPSKLVLEAVIPGAAEAERKLHQRFAEHRLSGEWFTLAENLDAFIKEAALVEASPEPNDDRRQRRISDEEAAEKSNVLHRQLLAEAMVDFARLGPTPDVEMPITKRLYRPVSVRGGQFNDAYAIRPIGEHRTLCADMGLTWDQADRLCDVLHAEKQRELRLDGPAPQEMAA